MSSGMTVSFCPMNHSSAQSVRHRSLIPSILLLQVITVVTWISRMWVPEAPSTFP
jgi:hypothetical protein